MAIDVPVGRCQPWARRLPNFVVAEALTDVAKHAHAQRAEVTTRVEGSSLHVEICDDGVDGAQPDGSGRLGIRDRLAVLDGRLRIDSPAGGGTLVASSFPSLRIEPLPGASGS